MNRARLEEQLCALPLAQYAFFRTDALEITPRVRAVCEQECPRYGQSWACPPAVGSVEACRRRVLAYPEGLLIVTLTEVNDIADMEETLATRPAHEKITRQVARLLEAEGVAPFVLSTESCAICETCTYPGAPCRHPEQMYPCVESHAILVTALADRLVVEYQYGGNVVTWFSLLLFRDEASTA